MNRILVVVILLITNLAALEAQLLKEYVRSFSLRNSDTILIDLQIPYELVDWDKSIVRTFSQVESFSLPSEILKKVARKGRYSIKGIRKNNVLRVFMPEVHHSISVKGATLTDEVIAKIYVPKNFPVKVICNIKTPEEQLKDLWLQQEVLTRRLKYPIRKAINADYYADVNFLDGKIIEASAVKGTKRFVNLKVEANGQEYNVVSRIGKLYEPEALLNKEVVFVAHTFANELRKLPNQGMVIVQENKSGALALITRADIPDFLMIN